ncbi:26S proteasome non-ATPase regulatory subunit 10-like [Dysidea avara]|uniref:26S proteasome non-ATPase regulatory subunit 10-like n=1 Tax=Dysidea avara TaxID=196820 RepID=UPI003320056A
MHHATLNQHLGLSAKRNGTQRRIKCVCKPLHLASTFGHSTVIKVLHDDGGNIDIEDPFEMCSLVYVERLEVELLESNNGGRPLHYAADGGHSETVKLLMELGADINVEDEAGSTPLHYAAQSGSEDVVKMIIEREADIHAVDNDKRTPLHSAAGSGNEAVVKFLVTKEADLNAMDEVSIDKSNKNDSV